MATFKIKKAGTSQAGNHWAMITNTIEGIVCRAFITCEKEQKEGKDLVIPKVLEKDIPWSL